MLALLALWAPAFSRDGDLVRLFFLRQICALSAYFVSGSQSSLLTSIRSAVMEVQCSLPIRIGDGKLWIGSVLTSGMLEPLSFVVFLCCWVTDNIFHVGLQYMYM